jgi:putative ABC transport system ATP-binding protein
MSESSETAVRPGGDRRPATDAVVALENVSKTYRLGEVAVPALTDISLAVRRQRLTMIVGPSGSGKTTLLNLIGCIDHPSQGRITACGTEVTALNDNALTDFRARNIAFIFQTFNLFPVLTAFENVEYPLLLLGMPARARRAASLAMLEQVGLADQRHHRPNQLSGGQRQRVAIARALVKAPEMVLADEPTANLDSRTGATIIELMRRIQHEQSVSFIFSTHDPQLISHAEETFHIRDGQVVDHRWEA